MISHEHQCIFIHNPRTAGTSIELAITGFDWWNVKPDEKHLPATKAVELYGKSIWDSYFKFSFVRNPWERMLSFYMYHSTPKEEGGDYVPQVAENSFKDFLYGHSQMFLSQFDMVTNDGGKVAVDFVGRFENLSEDFLYVSEQIGLTEPLPHAKQVMHRPYEQYYDEETKDIVARLYQMDIEYFEYLF